MALGFVEKSHLLSRVQRRVETSLRLNFEILNKHHSTKQEIQNRRLSLGHVELRICFGFRHSQLELLAPSRNGIPRRLSKAEFLVGDPRLLAEPSPLALPE